MADIVITVPISNIFREVSRRSSLATSIDPFYANKTTQEKQKSQLQGEGDRITSDFTKEASKEVLKVFLSRQGDVNGLGYEYDLNDSGNIVYRFAENDDPLPSNQTLAIKTRLIDNTEDAIIHYVLSLLYKTDGNAAKETEMLEKAYRLINMITGDLHRLHD
jgi:hypothetical protein